ncbi:uncharacterized protein ACR2FA_011948 [Aphomia sociella]
MAIPAPTNDLQQKQTGNLSEFVYSKSITEEAIINHNAKDMVPSAPTFEIEEQAQPIYVQHVIKQEVTPAPIQTKVQCMPLEQAIWMYGGKEMAEVRELSAREEAAVEAGPISGPEHPLVDLLSTLRQSYIALERDRTQLFNGFAEEEKYRSALWKIEKKTLHLSEQCKCGATVDYWGSYEHAQLMKEKMPAARMRLTALLRDVQECYCHHQHSALLAFCQIEDFLSEVIKTNKNEIREALTLILQALKLSDNAPPALSKALQRWATALSVALVDGRDLRQLLFLIHHLFRQTRSVRWAAAALAAGARVASGPALLAFLELLLARPALERAAECTEDAAECEQWEEVGRDGRGGAVSEGSLRERDLLALLHAAPLRRLVAHIMLFPDINNSGARSKFGYLSARILFVQGSEASACRIVGESAGGGGRGTLRAALGTRALLALLQRAHSAHPQYVRLQRALCRLAARTLHALAGLHLHTRNTYTREVRDEVTAELEQCYIAGVQLLQCCELQRLPATLLADHSASDYCYTLIIGLHVEANDLSNDKEQKPLETVPITIPLLTCEQRIEVVAQATVDRLHDHQLARVVLEFLLQAGVKRRASVCRAGCERAARRWLPRVLAAHPYIYTIGLHLLAEMHELCPLESGCVHAVRVRAWRPTYGDVRAVLDDWARRCPPLLGPLLLQLDYTPHTGVSLEVQLTIGSWLRSRISAGGGGPGFSGDWPWRVLRLLRPHRACWGLPLEAPDPDPEPDPADYFATAYALLSSSWGHCIPLICSRGAAALRRLASVRPFDAVHCLAGLMLALSHSPESVTQAHTFAEVFTTLLNTGPSLVQRALGLGGASGTQLLMQLMLAQLAEPQCGQFPRGALLSCWLRALWRPALAPALPDAALAAARDWRRADEYAAAMLQEYSGPQAAAWWRAAGGFPLVADCALRALLEREQRTYLPRLLDTLHAQRVAKQKIHVDKALQLIGAGVPADELVVYRAAGCALAAPLHHPAHLMLWRLLLHLHLQRPPCAMHESTPPIGPLFFSGIVKSRMLANLKKRLQETIIYHQNEAKSLSTCTTPNSETETQPVKNLIAPQTSETKRVKSSSTIDSDLPPGLTLTDFTGEADLSDTDSDEGNSEDDDPKEEKDEEDVEVLVNNGAEDDRVNLLSYHIAAEKMMREYAQWLDEGEKVRAWPQHADLARYMPDQALSAAWQSHLSHLQAGLPREPLPCLPRPAAPPATSRTRPTRPSSRTSLTTYQRTRLSNIIFRFVLLIQHLYRSKELILKSPVADLTYTDARMLLTLVDENINNIEQYAREWSNEVSRISSLDAQLLQLVTQLRVPRSLPPQRKRCPHKCKPVVLVTDAQEWCKSTGAENSIRENRTTARASVRRLMRPARAAVRAAVALLALARQVRSAETARRAVERAGRATAALDGCPPARSALLALVELLAQSWVCSDGAAVAALVSRWAVGGALQLALAGALLAPRRLPAHHWPRVYLALLNSALYSTLPSHIAFSYLSKFEMAPWSEVAPAEARRSVLEALQNAATRWGSDVDPQYHMLLELIGMHTAAVVRASELCGCVCACARAAVCARLHAAHWTHVLRATRVHAHGLSLDQLGNLLRELGAIWWEARNSGVASVQQGVHATHAAHVAGVLHELLRAFVAAAQALSYAPERGFLVCVGVAGGSVALLAAGEPHSAMLKHFLDALQLVITLCPGEKPSIYVIIRAFNLVRKNTYSVSYGTGPYRRTRPCRPRGCGRSRGRGPSPSRGRARGRGQECRLQMSAMLSAASRLPWDKHQWFRRNHLHAALQICRSPDKEITAWCTSTFRGLLADTWLCDVTEDQLAPHLAALFSLFTAANMPYSLQMLEEACRLPWCRLPDAVLEDALDQYFIEHHDPSLPYHEAPQFSVLLSACDMCAGVASEGGRRGRFVSRWQRGATSPALLPHVAAHCSAMLDMIATIAPYIEHAEGELEELFSRAVVIMCVEPAAAAALPVWVRWVGGAAAREVRACVSAAAALTTPEYFAALADAATRALLARTERGAWAEVSRRWTRCAWPVAGDAAQRGRLHAAYGLAGARTHTPRALVGTLMALLALSVDL